MHRKTQNKEIREKRKQKTTQAKQRDAKLVWSDWSILKVKLARLFHDYSKVPEVLILIIINYCAPALETTASARWEIDFPCGLLVFNNVCIFVHYIPGVS